MDRQTLVALEQATEPYRRRGFIVTSQSEGAITLSPPAKKFNYLLFLVTLLLFWPVAVLYLINFNSEKGKSVCIRITSQGGIEESGYTLAAIEKSRKRQLMTNLFIIVGTVALMIFILRLLGYL